MLRAKIKALEEVAQKIVDDAGLVSEILFPDGAFSTCYSNRLACPVCCPDDGQEGRETGREGGQDARRRRGEARQEATAQ